MDFFETRRSSLRWLPAGLNKYLEKHEVDAIMKV